MNRIVILVNNRKTKMMRGMRGVMCIAMPGMRRARSILLR